MALGAGQVLQAFHGYERGKEVGDGVPDVLTDEGSGRSMKLGRPLAMSLLIVDVFDGRGGSRANMLAVDPSGVVSEPLVAFGLGKGSDKANEMLGRQWRPDLGVAEVEKMCIGIIQDIAALDEKEKEVTRSVVDNDGTGVGAGAVQDDRKVGHIVCEILSKDGLSVKRLLLKEEDCHS